MVGKPVDASGVDSGSSRLTGWRKVVFWMGAVLLIAMLVAGTVFDVVSVFATSDVAGGLTAERVKVPVPKGALMWPGEGTVSTENGAASGAEVLTVKYKTEKWGEVAADFNDFRAKVAETLADRRGWVRAGLKFEEVSAGEDLVVALSDPAHLEALSGCSGDLSCTTWNNQVIINDVRWREGTEATRAVGMGQRDYQHMVVNHEMGHWLGHYAHVESCPNGGVAPVMLQQSTGMRGCDTFNAWPLEWELWTNKK